MLPGVKEVHAVDATGVHPLLLAVGSERYAPYQELKVPQEILTQACAILGQGQMSLAKYLMVVAAQDNPPRLRDLPAFFSHFLTRFDQRRDCHFITRTTMDTLDYSGTGLNEGSKVILAAVGPQKRTLGATVPTTLTLPDGFGKALCCAPGVVAVQGPAWQAAGTAQAQVRRLAEALRPKLRCLGDSTSPFDGPLGGLPVWVVVDDPAFCAQRFDNLLWATFTRSNPAVDIDGAGQPW